MKDEHKKHKESMQNEPHIDMSDLTETSSEELKFEPEIAATEEYPNKTKDVVADLRKRLKQAEGEKQEYLLGWQRAKADFINSRKQDEESNKQMVKYAEASLLTELIPVLDSFDMAFSNEAEVAKLPEVWRKGVEQIRSQLLAVLAAHNLEIIDPTGQDFDPREAEAVGVVETTDSAQDDKVVSVFQKGYKLQGRVLRPAKVKVGKYSGA